jgi:hypothetical protein
VVVPRHSSGKKIIGIVINKDASPDIALNARLVLEDRIGTKSKLCAQLRKPIWLVLLNDYWLANAGVYAEVYRKLNLTHCFERIFLVNGDGTVAELTGAA